MVDMCIFENARQDQRAVHLYRQYCLTQTVPIFLAAWLFDKSKALFVNILPHMPRWVVWVVMRRWL